MRIVSAVLATLLLSMPAQAAWQLYDDVDEDGQYYIASQVDPESDTELQFICDTSSEGYISMMLYTGDAYRRAKEHPASFPVTLTIDGRIEQALSGSIEAFEGEQLLMSHGYDGPQVEGKLPALRKSKSDITINFEGKSLSYPSEGISAVLAGLIEGCPTLAVPEAE